MIKIYSAALLSAISAIVVQATFPVYTVDFDQPASTRYNEIFNDFREPLLEMEQYWYSVIPDYAQNIIKDNMDLYMLAQPENYATLDSLAKILDLPVYQTVLVNMIVELSTFCTSIVARNDQGEIVHVRNLDFGDTANMKQLVVEVAFVKDGVEKARGPIIAGFLGAYTGQKPGVFSVSYNVRESTPVPIEA